MHVTTSFSTRHPSRVVLACLPLLFVAAACTPAATTPSPSSSPASTATPDSTPDATASPDATPTPTRPDGCVGPILDAAVCVNTSTAVALRDGLLTDVREVGVADKPPAWSTVIPVTSLQPDGSLGGARSPGSAQGYRLPLSVGVYGPDGTLKPAVTESDEPARGVVGVAYDGTHLVWKESTDTTQSTEQWWIRTAVDGTVKTLAASTDSAADGQLPNAGTLITIVGDSVVWVAGLPDATAESGGAKSVLMTAKLDGSGPAKSLAENAYYPTADGAGNLYYVTVGDSGVPSIAKLAPDGTTTTAVDHPDDNQLALVGLAADATRVAWFLAMSTTDSNGQALYVGWIYVLDTTTKVVTEVGVLAGAGGGNVLSLSNGWLAWGAGSGQGDTQQYLMNLATNTIYTLGDSSGASWVALNFPAVAWTAPPEGTRFAYVRTFVGLLNPAS